MINLKQQGFRMPAEWEEQEAILLSWPHNSETWPHQLASVQDTYITLIKEIIHDQEVWLNVNSDDVRENVLSRLQGTNLNQLKIFVIPTHDAWIRDYGPITVVNGKQRLFTSWQFNGWGDKYDEGYFKDNAVPAAVAYGMDVPIQEIDFILEGGSIEVNGKGTLLTSTNCLLNANRNQSQHQKQIETVLCEALGVSQIIWVTGEIEGDDTDGHIDDVARFVNHNTVVCNLETSEQDINYESSQRIFKQLCEARDQDGDLLNIVPLPFPEPVLFEGKRLPASYANFLITNEKVLVPIFKCEQDQKAISILQNFFPQRRVIGIDCRDVVYGLGAIHCLSQQVPLA